MVLIKDSEQKSDENYMANKQHNKKRHFKEIVSYWPIKLGCDLNNNFVVFNLQNNYETVKYVAITFLLKFNKSFDYHAFPCKILWCGNLLLFSEFSIHFMRL